MSLIVYQVALKLTRELQPLIPSIAPQDKNLALQLRRCASSVVLNVAEGEDSDAGTRRSRFHTAAGSASETRAVLHVATCWRYFAGERAQPSLALADEVIAILWSLTH